MGSLISKKNIFPALQVTACMLGMLITLSIAHDLGKVNPISTPLDLRVFFLCAAVLIGWFALCAILKITANYKSDYQSEQRAQRTEQCAQQIAQLITKDSIKGVMRIDGNELKLIAPINENNQLNISDNTVSILIYYPEDDNIKIIHSLKIHSPSKVDDDISYTILPPTASSNGDIYLGNIGSTKVTLLSFNEECKDNLENSGQLNVTICQSFNVLAMAAICEACNVRNILKTISSLFEDPLIQGIVPNMQLQPN